MTSETNVCGFSTKWRTRPVRSSTTTTPYAESEPSDGTRVVRTVASTFCCTCVCSRSFSGYEQSTSQLTTKKGEAFAPSDVIIASAALSGPAVPSDSSSLWHVIVMPSSASHART